MNKMHADFLEWIDDKAAELEAVEALEWEQGDTLGAIRAAEERDLIRQTRERFIDANRR